MSSELILFILSFVLPRRLLDRYSWDEKRVVELYRRSVERRKDLGMDAVKREIQRDNLQLDSLPHACLLYTSPSPRDGLLSRMPSSA